MGSTFLLAVSLINHLGITLAHTPSGIRQTKIKGKLWLSLLIPGAAFGFVQISLQMPGGYSNRITNNYHLATHPVHIQGVDKNASGITFNPDTETLFVVINSPEKLLELDRNGNVFRQIALVGFHDTEGVVYLGNQQFAIIEERRNTVVLININDDTSTIDRHSQRSLSLPPAGIGNNKGLEGLAADRVNNRLYIVNEKTPRQLLQIDGFIDNSLQLSVSEPWRLEDSAINGRDFAGLHFNNQKNSLLLLSEESRRVYEVDTTGNLIEEISLNKNSSGLTENIPQPEGITLDNQGSLFIISEPNLFYRFDRS
ncbi:MAG: SdiA-regulated domain-containing protein [Porticoccaceae bacterium]|nr:SdiA-regulated domain-containing protein [Pseudomonadales bacterium]MCP5173133.1 SdiA-regulated domain-containing protein [Pseudomonadales bacterium]